MIMSIDPGINTGIAYRFDNEALGTLTVEKPPDETVEAWDRSMLDIISFIVGHKPSTVVIESFLGIQMQSKYGIETMELIGAVRGCCLSMGIMLVKQPPAYRMTSVPMAKDILQLMKERFNKPYTNHEVSALSHLLAYERKLANARKTAVI